MLLAWLQTCAEGSGRDSSGSPQTGGASEALDAGATREHPASLGLFTKLCHSIIFLSEGPQKNNGVFRKKNFIL